MWETIVGRLGKIFIGYFHPLLGILMLNVWTIRCVAAGSKFAISGGSDDSCKIYDMLERRELGTLQHHDVRCKINHQDDVIKWWDKSRFSNIEFRWNFTGDSYLRGNPSTLPSDQCKRWQFFDHYQNGQLAGVYLFLFNLQSFWHDDKLLHWFCMIFIFYRRWLSSYEWFTWHEFHPILRS